MLNNFMAVSIFTRKSSLQHGLSFECAQGIGDKQHSCICDWLKNLWPLCQPISNKTKTNRNTLGRVFPRLACICLSSDWFRIG